MLADELIKPLLWGMNALSLKQKTTAQNLANANTPGYKRQMVAFNHVLAEQMGDGLGIGDPPPAAMPQSGPEWDLGIQFAKSNFAFDQLWGEGKAPVAPLGGPEPAAPFTVSVTTDPGAMRVDGNGVAIEREVGEMHKNAGQYNLLATRASGEFKILTTILQAR
jgi:flagellar basal body rod protein FlgB